MVEELPNIYISINLSELLFSPMLVNCAPHVSILDYQMVPNSSANGIVCSFLKILWNISVV